MNCYATFTLDDSIRCSSEDAKDLARLLKRRDRKVDPDDNGHGMKLFYDAEGGEVYLSTDESAWPEFLPRAFLKKLGQVIDKTGKPYVGFGIAYSADRSRPGTHGGNIGRIYADGALEMANQLFPRDVAAAIDGAAQEIGMAIALLGQFSTPTLNIKLKLEECFSKL